MGSSFFKSMDPMYGVERILGSTGAGGQAAYYDPVVNTGVGKTLFPGSYQAGQSWGATHALRNQQDVAYPYAGRAPTLADANNGYVAAAQAAANKPAVTATAAVPPPRAQIPMVPRAWGY